MKRGKLISIESHNTFMEEKTEAFKLIYEIEEKGWWRRKIKVYTTERIVHCPHYKVKPWFEEMEKKIGVWRKI